MLPVPDYDEEIHSAYMVSNPTVITIGTLGAGKSTLLNRLAAADVFPD